MAKTEQDTGNQDCRRKPVASHDASLDVSAKRSFFDDAIRRDVYHQGRWGFEFKKAGMMPLTGIETVSCDPSYPDLALSN